MILYLDPSAWVKRYVLEPGSDLLQEAAAAAAGAFMSRIGFVEMHAALGRSRRAAEIVRFRSEWSAMHVIELNEGITTRAASIAQEGNLRSIDAVHLASALALPREDLLFASWDRRLHAAARGEGLAVLPEALD